MSKIQVYCAVSLDGFIAGPDNDLDWLGAPDVKPAGDSDAVEFSSFLEQMGSMLMGRRTFDVVRAFGGAWPYGSTPVLVATTRPLPPDAPATVSPCQGDIADLCDRAKKVGGDKHVYLDGGNLVTQAIDADCVDELILTLAPVFLGRGVALYQGKHLQRFQLEYLGQLGAMAQIRLTRAKKKRHADAD